MEWLDCIYAKISFVKRSVKLGHLVNSSDFDGKINIFCFLLTLGLTCANCHVWKIIVSKEGTFPWKLRIIWLYLDVDYDGLE